MKIKFAIKRKKKMCLFVAKLSKQRTGWSVKKMVKARNATET